MKDISLSGTENLKQGQKEGSKGKKVALPLT